MALTMLVDGVDLSTQLGFEVTNADTRRAAPSRQWATDRSVLRAQRVLVSQEPRYEARELVVEGRLKAVDAATYVANRDELAARLDDAGDVEISFSDDTDRVYDARFIGLDTRATTLASLSRDALTLRFLMLDPFARDSGLTTVAFGATPAEVELGTAPVEDAVIRVHGPFTNPSIRLRQAGLFHLEDGEGIEPTTDATFTRPSSATYSDAAGNIATASSGAVRKFHYVDDENGARVRARKLEAARTNSLLDSEVLSSTSPNWTATNVTTTTPSGLLAPDGSTTVFRLDDSTGSSVGELTQDVAVTASTDASTLSCFLRKQASTGSFPAIELQYRGSTAGDFSAGLVVDTTGASISDTFGSTGQVARSGLIDQSTSWVRPWIAVHNDGSSGSLTIRSKLLPAASTGSGTKASLQATHDFWGAQLETS